MFQRGKEMKYRGEARMMHGRATISRLKGTCRGFNLRDIDSFEKKTESRQCALRFRALCKENRQPQMLFPSTKYS